jgi:hypothetical protein
MAEPTQFHPSILVTGPSETICWTAGPAETDAGAMDFIPALWTTAYSPDAPTTARLLAHRLLRLRDFLRALALTDHTPFGGY